MHRRSARVLSFALLGLFVTSGIGLFVFAPTASAGHDTVNWSSFWGVTFDARYQFNPTSFADGNGHLYLFFYDQNPSNQNTNITMWRYSTRGPSGNPTLQLTRQVNPTLPNIVRAYNYYGFPQPVSVAQDHNGALYVAWSDTKNNVSVSKSSDAGSTWGAPARVDPSNLISLDTGPVIVASPTGTLYVAWLRFWSPGGSRSITVARSFDQGVTWSGKTNVTVSRTVDFYTHALAVDSLGRLHLVHTFATGPVANWDSNYTWSDDGLTWSAPARLDSSTSYGIYPAIAVDASNRVHVFWYDGRESTSRTNTYWYRRSDDRGASWTMEMPISQGRYGTGGGALLTLAVRRDTVIAGWYATSGGVISMGYTISADGGDMWYPEEIADFRSATAYSPSLTADENGTFYAAFYRWNEFLSSYDAAFSVWDGPPSAPTITDIARGTGSLTVSWSASPDGDVAGYRLWRSTDGVTYELAGTFGVGTLSYADNGLSNGTYWYRVTSFDSRGTASHASDPMSAAVGKSVSEMIDDLEAALNSAQADITSIQAQLDGLRTQLGTQDAALQSRIDDLQARLNVIRSEQATQSQTWILTLLVIIVIVLLVFMFLQQRRMLAMRSQIPRSMRMPPPQEPATPPSMAPGPPAQAPPMPEDDL